MKHVIICIVCLMLLSVVGVMSAYSADTATIEFVAEQEGYRPIPHKDVTQYSVGHGINVKWMDSHGYPSMLVSKTVARRALVERLDESITHVKGRIPEFSSLPQGVKTALISADYNCPALIGPNLRKHIRERNFDKASKELALGHNPKGLMGLVTRRFAEANLMRKSMGMRRLATPGDMEEFMFLKNLWKQGRY